VKNVEFYIDGAIAVIDGNYPFEQRLISPLRTAAKTSFTLRAKATDTGGNSTWTDEFTFNLVPDATPPKVTRTFPDDGAIVGASSLVSATFSEPLATGSIVPEAFTLMFAGADDVIGTADDALVPGGTLDYRTSLNSIFQQFPQALEPGHYYATVRAPISDLTGNAIAKPKTWQFWVLGQQDSDNDGIPDSIEAALGYDPNNPDSNGNGVLDGDEDLDGDGLKNRWELLWGYDPRKKDSDDNSVNDGAEDPDADGLTNLAEQQASTNPRNPDSDGDGWDDNGELLESTNPLDSASRPEVVIHAMAEVSFLNAAPLPLPVNVVGTVTSPPVSYLNALPLPLPADTKISLVSLPASYLNALPLPLPVDTTVSVASPVTSYLNSNPLPLGPDNFIASPVISYEKQPGVQSAQVSIPR
jgi:hypothetical protein